MLARQRFQSFDDPAGASEGAGRLATLRAELARRNLDGFIVPRADEHQGEYVPPHAERLRWLTGFAGSAGLAIVLTDRAAIFVDGRYTLQVRDQVDVSAFEPLHLVEEPPHEWLARCAKPGHRIGYDPWLHTQSGIDTLKEAVERGGAALVPCTDNPLDAVWKDQPAPPLSPVTVYAEALAGDTSAAKRGRIAGDLAKAKAGAAVITLPESICWLLNVRGGDVPHTPFALSFAILHESGELEWFIDERKISNDVRAHLGNAVTIRQPEALAERLAGLGPGKTRVIADPATAASAVFDILARSGATIVKAPDPCLLPKACKNEAELSGIRAAHLRDGAALTRFLAWVAHEGKKGGLTEIEATKRLEDFRAETGRLKDLSFDTISGAGANGAIVHYRVTNKTDRPLKPGELFLIDSGGQYEDGTTDVTRTIAIGTPSDEQRRCFTLVLKGHIALAMARFPEGTTGAQLDALARLPLWQAGLDYDHGTGHGVGHFLSVHEGPQNISKRGHTTPLKTGMVCSNEPGYYKTGAFGIRIENLIAVKPPEAIAGGERPMHSFETLTLAPIDLALIDLALLTQAERAWLNAYHARVRECLTPHVDATTAAWLEIATGPL